MLELPFCPVCLGRADTSLSFFVGTSEICRHGTRAKTTKIFSGCSGPKYWATKQIVIKWPKKAPPLPPRLWEFSQPGGWRSAQATHQHRAPGRTLYGGVSPVVTTPWAYLQIADNAHGRCGLKNSWGEICLIAFFARPIFAFDHFWHLIYFDFDLLIVWWPNQKRPWNTAAQHTVLESIGGTCCQECLECYAWCSRDQGRGPALPPRNNSGHAGMFTFNLKHTNNLKLVKKLSPNYF